MKRYYSIAIIFLLVSAAYGAVTQEEALDAILRAENDIKEMEEAGFSTVLAKDLLLEAQEAFKGLNFTKLMEETKSINDTQKRKTALELLEAAKKVGTTDYTLAIEKTSQIAEIKKTAFAISDEINALKLRLEDDKSARVNTETVENDFSKIVDSFNTERYDETKELIEAANNKLSELELDATRADVLISTKGADLLNAISQNWQIIAIYLSIIFAAGMLARWRLSKLLMKRKLSNLMLEKRVLEDLMKKAQTERFAKGAITKKEYEIKMEKFKELMTTTEKNITYYKARIAGKKVQVRSAGEAYTMGGKIVEKGTSGISRLRQIFSKSYTSKSKKYDYT